METIKEKLESDAEKMLCFMASNGLVANPDKTVYMMLGRKKLKLKQTRSQSKWAQPLSKTQKAPDSSG